MVLAVCGGYQLLGHSYQLGDRELPGVGLVDLRTVREPGPAADRQLRHRGGPRRRPARDRRLREPRRAHLPRARASARSAACSQGTATTARDGIEGVHRGNVIGTYLHGPLLPKNVWLADRLIELALGVRLEPLADDTLEDAAHAGARRAAGV